MRAAALSDSKIIEELEQLQKRQEQILAKNGRGVLPAETSKLKKRVRVLKNRLAAKRSREQKKEYIGNVEVLIQQLRVENAKLKRENEELRAREGAGSVSSAGSVSGASADSDCKSQASTPGDVMSDVDDDEVAEALAAVSSMPEEAQSRPEPAALMSMLDSRLVLPMGSMLPILSSGWTALTVRPLLCLAPGSVMTSLLQPRPPASRSSKVMNGSTRVPPPGMKQRPTTTQSREHLLVRHRPTTSPSLGCSSCDSAFLVCALESDSHLTLDTVPNFSSFANTHSETYYNSANLSYINAELSLEHWLHPFIVVAIVVLNHRAHHRAHQLNS